MPYWPLDHRHCIRINCVCKTIGFFRCFNMCEAHSLGNLGQHAADISIDACQQLREACCSLRRTSQDSSHLN